MKNLMTIAALLFGLAVLTSSSTAQTGLELVDVDLLFVGAHPDDDTFVMLYCRKCGSSGQTSPNPG